MADVKLIRKQLHNILQSNPDLLKQELYKAAFDELRAEITGRLNIIEGNIKRSLDQMEERQKDIHSMITRAAFAAPVETDGAERPPTEQPAETSTEEVKAGD